jgi:hypothetical protein
MQNRVKPRKESMMVGEFFSYGNLTMMQTRVSYECVLLQKRLDVGFSPCEPGFIPKLILVGFVDEVTPDQAFG